MGKILRDTLSNPRVELAVVVAVIGSFTARQLVALGTVGPSGLTGPTARYNRRPRKWYSR